MDLLIDSAAGNAMFPFMDGFNGYNQIRMAPKDVEKTVFRTPIGNFYYTVMPLGLKNAGTTYQRTMTAIFHNMMHRELEDYVDDIVVKSKRREEHIQILKRVFERCKDFKLRLNRLKCAFGVSSRKFIGFLVHSRGIDVDSTKATAIVNIKSPAMVKELKSVVGLFWLYWAGLPPAVLGPNILSKGVKISPTVTQFGPACAQTMPRSPRARL